MFAFSDEPAVQAVFAYLSSDVGGQNWAAAGFGLTPNLAGADAYTDPQLQKQGAILNAAQGFTPDIGDTIPSGFGSAEFEAVVNYLNGADLQGELDRLATLQAEALGE
jgi:alpha-glucoside transport system substrate-binding protein